MSRKLIAPAEFARWTNLSPLSRTRYHVQVGLVEHSLGLTSTAIVTLLFDTRSKVFEIGCTFRTRLIFMQPSAICRPPAQVAICSTHALLRRTPHSFKSQPRCGNFRLRLMVKYDSSHERNPRPVLTYGLTAHNTASLEHSQLLRSISVAIWSFATHPAIDVIPRVRSTCDKASNSSTIDQMAASCHRINRALCKYRSGYKAC